MKDDVENELARREKPKVNGVYVNGSINGIEVTYTVDTGASCTLLATKVFEKIPETKRPELQETSLKISGAGGSTLNILGIATFRLEIGSVCVKKSMIVTDITDEILLGADILLGDAYGKVDLLLSEGIMMFQGVEIPLESEGLVHQIRRVHLADNYELPAMSEIVVDVFVDRSKNDTKLTPFIIEPNELLAEKYDVIMAPSLVEIEQNVTAGVRIMNPFPKPVTLR